MSLAIAVNARIITTALCSGLNEEYAGSGKQAAVGQDAGDFCLVKNVSQWKHKE